MSSPLGRLVVEDVDVGWHLRLQRGIKWGEAGREERKGGWHVGGLFVSLLGIMDEGFSLTQASIIPSIHLFVHQRHG